MTRFWSGYLDFTRRNRAVFMRVWPQKTSRKLARTFNQMIGYLQSRQEAQSGLFVDSHYPEMRKQERVMGRALQFSVASLRLLGAQPLHALPGTRQESLPDRFSSLDKLRGWLNALDWEQPWQALDAVSSQKTVLKLMPPEQHKPLVEFIYNYVKAKQDPQTGMVGGGEPIVRISGMAKFGWFCQEFDLPLPRADADLGFVMAWYRSQPEVTTLTMVRNPIHHLVDLQPFLSQPMTQDNKALVVRESARLLRGFRQNDGAFSMQKAQFPLRPNDLWPPIGNSSQPQSDLNGTSQARTIREKAYALAGISPDKVPLMNGTKEFWRQWQRRVP